MSNPQTPTTESSPADRVLLALRPRH
ncbi:MAG: hypothetical protein QOI66_2028, partial [Myxococcales bacterium]|nr:hypothetical protein [Myxococcales bacterium]